jgi:hypothetical protein
MPKFPIMMMNMPFGQDGPQEPNQKDAYIPARVTTAMEFVSMLHHKQAERAAVSESQIQVLNGQKISPEEEATMQVALNMLAHYFEGSLKPDSWETKKPQKTQILVCPACGQPGDHKCPLCKGKGTIVVLH